MIMRIKKRTKHKLLKVFGIISTLLFLNSGIQAQPSTYQLYPYTYDSLPELASPYTWQDSIEIVLVITKDNQYAVVPVTMENGKPLLYSYKVGTFMGKDQQMHVDGGDFPDLAKTGLHSEEQLNTKEMITGIPIDVINCTGQTNAYSRTGFMAEDENIISVLKGDNQLVKAMELTHPQLAKPLCIIIKNKT
jgi:hypothetical protein